MINEKDLEYLSENKDTLEHFVALSNIKSYQWINREGELIDLRRANIYYLIMIKEWMLKNSYRQTPYDDTPAFFYINKRILTLENREKWARDILRKGL